MRPVNDEMTNCRLKEVSLPNFYFAAFVRQRVRIKFPPLLFARDAAKNYIFFSPFGGTSFVTIRKMLRGVFGVGTRITTHRVTSQHNTAQGIIL